MDAWYDVTPEEPDRSPLAAARREVVRTAEQTVGDAWIARLLLAETEAEQEVEACSRRRAHALGRLGLAHRRREQRDPSEQNDLNDLNSPHIPQTGADPTELTRAHAELAHADEAWERALAAYADARARLTEELAAWADATALRLRQAWADRTAAGRR